jgi:hypothetical protein
MQTKKEVFEFFDEKISTSSIAKDGDDWVVRGKHGDIAVMDNTVDCWITSANSKRSFGQRKINLIIAGLPADVIENLDTTYMDEATFTVPGDTDKAVLVDIAIALGARRKAVYSPEATARRTATLQASREQRQNA